MDYDGDGIRDLISGSYDPGHLYLFRGTGGGAFAERETILDKSGTPVRSKPVQKDRVESFGSWVAMVDWDADGDLDIVLGTFGGEMLLRLNQGTRGKPSFATENVPIQAAGKPIRVPDHHATPVVADWDGDGRWDLLTGSASGAVYWYRNAGQEGEPKLEAARQLVAKHEGIGYNEFLGQDADTVPGIRSQICVADWNLDGKLDLLVGDFCTTVSPRGDLSRTQRAEMQSILARLDALGPKIAAKQKAVDAAFDEWSKKAIPREEWFERASQERMREKNRALATDLGLAELRGESGKLRERLKEFLAESATPEQGDKNATSRGYVWLFVRK